MPVGSHTEGPGGKRVTVVIVDDHRVTREGTRQLLERAGVAIVGEVGTGPGAVALAKSVEPTVMLVDVHLPGMSGIDVVRRVAEAGLPVRCLVFSAFDDHVFVTEALAAGACGYLLKTASAAELVAAVAAVAEGAIVLDSTLTASLMGRTGAGDAAPAPVLTPRELDVVRLMARGRSNKEIAADLRLGLRTVETYVSNVLAKLGARSRTQAVLKAIGQRLVSAEVPQPSRP
jgi:DNA-binding NarL/FixJ family response regulator